MADIQQMASLPMDQLICSPIVAAAQAQSQLVGITLDFIERVCTLNGTTSDPLTGKQTKNADSVLKDGVLSFPIERYDPDTGTMVQQKIAAPILSLVTIPNFAMDSIDVSFEMEVKNSTTGTDTLEAKAEAKASGGFWGCDFEVSGSVASKSENSRSSDSSAKYTINAKAKQMEQSEGMGKLCQILASTIEPLPESTVVRPNPATTP